MKLATKKYMFGLIMVISLIIGGVFLQSMSLLNPPAVPDKTDSIIMFHDFADWNIADYTRNSTAIIIGRVREVGDVREVINNNTPRFYQDVTFDIEEVLKGDPKIKSMVLITPSNPQIIPKDRNYAIFAEDPISFHPGEKVLAFIAKDEDGLYVPFLHPSSKFLIDKNNNASNNKFKMSLAELKTQIQEALKNLSGDESTSQIPGAFTLSENLYIARDIPFYTKQSLMIIIGEVTDVIDRRLTNNNISRFYQDVTFDLKEILKGDPGMTKMTVLVEGWPKFEKDEMHAFSAEGDVNFNPGEKVLLFVGKNFEGEYVSFAGPYSKYLIDENNNVSSIGDFRGDFRMSLTELKTQIQEALKLPSKKQL
jgi:hypothetical protein